MNSSVVALQKLFVFGFISCMIINYLWVYYWVKSSCFPLGSEWECVWELERAILSRVWVPKLDNQIIMNVWSLRWCYGSIHIYAPHWFSISYVFLPCIFSFSLTTLICFTWIGVFWEQPLYLQGKVRPPFLGFHCVCCYCWSLRFAKSKNKGKFVLVLSL